MFFETNGVPRVVEIAEAKAMEAKASREKGDPNLPGSVSAPMSGEVIKINVQAGKHSWPKSSLLSSSSPMGMFKCAKLVPLF